MLGFTGDRAAQQAAAEKSFDAALVADDQRQWMEQMAAAPNHVGSPHNKANAEYMLGLFQQWGWQARIESFDVLYPTPKKVALQLLAPTSFTAKLQEPAVEGDRTSVLIDQELPPYHAFGADGDVTGELVYVNRGMPDDYKDLARMGIEVKGRIVIARYGGGWRGLKPKLAYEHGAIGCIIYSDPADDGYGAGDAYPKGGFRPADGVQRGSVMDMPIHPGDPLTPGIGATEGARRLKIEEAETVLKIPVLPISHADALPLLRAIDGLVVPEHWRGALPLTYHAGPGPAKVRLIIESDWSLKKIYNVIATLPGQELPDEWVVRGNHHDGWVCGASDPLSGNVALMAEAKAIGALVKQGWHPRRTLVYCSWDAEEPGLIGSTEWVETHAEELQRKAVLYVNTDGNGRGFISASGSHSFQTMVNEVADSVIDPQTGVTALQRRRARILVDAAKKGADDEVKRQAKALADGGPWEIGALGSGSDYTAFIDHLGIAALNVSFSGEDDTDGVYHSAYDSFDHYRRFGDPGFVYGVALAQTAGRLVLRTASADVLPVRAGDFATRVGDYVQELHKLEDAKREATEQQRRLLAENLYTLAADPTKKELPPEPESAVPFLNLSPLDNAIARLKPAARDYDAALARATAAGLKIDPAPRAELAALLRTLEQSLLAADGLPGRPWFRHLIYAPGLKTGYGAKTLPGVREAIEDRRWPEAERYAALTAAALVAYAEKLEQAAKLLP